MITELRNNFINQNYLIDLLVELEGASRPYPSRTWGMVRWTHSTSASEACFTAFLARMSYTAATMLRALTASVVTFARFSSGVCCPPALSFRRHHWRVIAERYPVPGKQYIGVIARARGLQNWLWACAGAPATVPGPVLCSATTVYSPSSFLSRPLLAAHSILQRVKTAKKGSGTVNAKCDGRVGEHSAWRAALRLDVP